MLLNNIGPYFVQRLPFCVWLIDFLKDRSRHMRLAEHKKNDVFSKHHLRRHVQRIHIPGDVNLDHLLKMVSVRFHHCF